MNIEMKELLVECTLHLEKLEGDLELIHNEDGTWMFDTSYMWCPKGNNAPDDDLENYCTEKWLISVQDDAEVEVEVEVVETQTPEGISVTSYIEVEEVPDAPYDPEYDAMLNALKHLG